MMPFAEPAALPPPHRTHRAQRLTRYTICLLGLLALLDHRAQAQALTYAWGPTPGAETLEHRVPPPPGAHRVPVEPRSFAAFLRALPLLPPGSPVRLWNGALKERQDVHAAVIDLDVPRRDLQQCADAVMRMRAEYLYSLDRFGDIVFHPDPGRPRRIAYAGGSNRTAFARYLIRVFADAGSASLDAEMKARGGPALPGDVLIQGGHPGHAVLILDAAVDAEGHRLLLIGQSYMPAQQLHLLKNPASTDGSPWYDEAALDGAGLRTPEWRPFTRAQLKRFPD